jgi:hypothetical protein
MTGFDETALKRLEALVTKSKSGGKLQAAEALELKELKLLKSAAEIAKGRAEIAVARRKMEDREKYRVGGLAVAAGLSAWPDDELKGGFAMLAGLNETVRTALAEQGRQAPGNGSADFGAFLTSLPHAPDLAHPAKGESTGQADLLIHADVAGGAQGSP